MGIERFLLRLVGNKENIVTHGFGYPIRAIFHPIRFLRWRLTCTDEFRWEFQTNSYYIHGLRLNFSMVKVLNGMPEGTLLRMKKVKGEWLISKHEVFQE